MEANATSDAPTNGAQADFTSVTLRGRMFSSEDIGIVSRCVNQHFDRGRTFISRVICDELGWRQPNGWPKDRACRDALQQLERLGIIGLPPARLKKQVTIKSNATSTLAKYDLSSPITEFPKHISLEFAKGNRNEQRWNEVISQYHYLGHKVGVGRCIKYLITSEDNLLGAIAFSSPAWRLDPRDSLLSLLGIDTVSIRDYVISNTRFLILPNVRVKNLASTVLSLATSKVVGDWTDYYSVIPKVAETFVQPSRFRGTCYKAANWVEIGITKGYAKRGCSYYGDQEPKRIFLYGLNPNIRRKLARVLRDTRRDFS